jgi:hypothetical protein
VARSNVKEHALREINLIAQGSNPQQSPVIEEFQKCPEWQLAAAILARAIGQEQRRGTEAVIAVPAKWLPPLL